METLLDFPCFKHIRSLDMISKHNKTNLLSVHMFKVDVKNTLEQDVKHV